VANLSQTITNQVRCFGAGPSSLWNSHNWGSFRWGEGTRDIRTDVLKGISNTLTPTSTIPGFQIRKGISETITVVGDMGSEELSDSAGYEYVFPDRTTEAEDRSFATWSTASSAAGSWTAASAASSAWSES